MRSFMFQIIYYNGTNLYTWRGQKRTCEIVWREANTWNIETNLGEIEIPSIHGWLIPLIRELARKIDRMWRPHTHTRSLILRISGVWCVWMTHIRWSPAPEVFQGQLCVCVCPHQFDWTCVEHRVRVWLYTEVETRMRIWATRGGGTHTQRESRQGPARV